MTPMFISVVSGCAIAYGLIWFLIGKWYGRRETIAEYLKLYRINNRFKGDV